MDEADGYYRMQLIGPFGLYDLDGRRIEISSKKAMALLALLVTAPDGERSRTWLQSMLWGSRAPAQAQGSFRRELSNLAKLLDEHGAGRLLLRASNRVALARDVILVDFLELAAGRKPASALGHGEFLEGLDLRDCEEFEGWLRERRRVCLEWQNHAGNHPDGIVQQVLGDSLPPVGTLLSQAPKSLPLKPSVAVLPFRAHGNPDAAEALGIGIAEEIELCLMRLQSLFVGATRSTLVLSKRGLTLTEIARQLGVRYLIDGTIENDGEEARVTVVLIDGQSGHQVWLRDFAGAIGNRLELQRQIAREVAPRIHSRIDVAALNEGLKTQAPVGTAHQLYWRANAVFRSWNEAALLEASALCARLLEIDPTCAWGAAMAAFCDAACHSSGWGEAPVERREAALRHMALARRLAPDDVTVMGYLAGTHILLGSDLEEADRLIEVALGLIPGHQPTLFWGGWIDIVMGRPVRARERFELSLRINPEAGVRPHTLSGIGIATLMQADAETARSFLSAARALIPEDPTNLAALAVAAWHCGQAAEARAALAALETTGTNGAVGTVLHDPAIHRALAEVREAARADRTGTA